MNNRLVYSTESRPADVRRAPVQEAELPPAAQSAVVSRSRRGRGGKTVTLIEGLRHCPAAFEKLATELKRYCGTGGTVKDGVIEIQGDHRDKVAATLAAKGYRVKLSGG